MINTLGAAILLDMPVSAKKTTRHQNERDPNHGPALAAQEGLTFPRAPFFNVAGKVVECSRPAKKTTSFVLLLVLSCGQP